MDFIYIFYSDSEYIYFFLTLPYDFIKSLNSEQQKTLEIIRYSAAVDILDSLSSYLNINKNKIKEIPKSRLTFVNRMQNDEHVSKSVMRAPIEYYDTLKSETRSVLNKLNLKVRLTVPDLNRLARFKLFTECKEHPVYSCREPNNGCKFDVLEYKNRAFFLVETLSDAVFPKYYLPLWQGYEALNESSVFDTIKLDRIKKVVIFHPYAQEIRQHFTAITLTFTKDDHNKIHANLELFDPKVSIDILAQLCNQWQKISSLNFQNIRKFLSVSSFTTSITYGNQSIFEHTECGHRVYDKFSETLDEFINDSWVIPASPNVTTTALRLNTALSQSTVKLTPHSNVSQRLWQNNIYKQLDEGWERICCK